MNTSLVTFVIYAVCNVVSIVYFISRISVMLSVVAKSLDEKKKIDEKRFLSLEQRIVALEVAIAVLSARCFFCPQPQSKP